jgi:dienelactone hydrolase
MIRHLITGPSAFFLMVFLFALTPVSVPAQSKPGATTSQGVLPVEEMIHNYLTYETAKLSQRFLDGATTLGEWQARRPRLRREYLDMLGLWPLPEKTPLHATITGTLEHGDVVIEKLHFQSQPHLYVTGNLYRPKKVEGKLPAVLYVCGHSNRGRDGNKTAYQDHGLWFATNGYICLMLDTLQLGEIPGVHHGTYNRGRWWWQALGYTPAGVECWNGIRGIDYLLSRPEVDPTRLAVTGISGGGASTFWIAAADERVRCAVPVSGMSDLESYVSHKVINGHCDCMFLVNTYGWQWTTIAALIAPRPLFFCNSDQDKIFPMDGNQRIIERLRKLYQMYGKPELVDAYVSRGGHAYRPDLRKAVFQWINRHLKNDIGPVQDADFPPIPGKELRVFPKDKDVPKDAVNAKIDELFIARSSPPPPEAGGFDNWKRGLMKTLREKVFHAFPERIPALHEAPEGSVRNDRRWVMHCESEPRIEVLVSAPLPRNTENLTQRTLLVFGAGEGSATGPIPDWAKPYADDKAWRLWPRACGINDPKRSNRPPNYIERAPVLLGRTLDEGKVWDIAATARHLDDETHGKAAWKVVGRGEMGILAAYAALFEPAIQEVVVIDPPATHRDGPIFLNVLRILDIPDALGLLAPRRLTLVNARDTAFDKTVQIYHVAGAGRQLMRR